MTFPNKSALELFEEFEENGYVTHICPDCGDECLPTEIDNDKARCENCQDTKTFRPLI